MATFKSSSNVDSLNVKKIVGALAAQREQAFHHIQQITGNTPASFVSKPKAFILSAPLNTEDSFAEEMRLINKLAALTLETVVCNSKSTTVYKTRVQIVDGLRGMSDLYVGKDHNLMYRGGWVAMSSINLNGFSYGDVFPEKITDVEMNPDKSGIRATYGHKGYVAQIRYYGEYVPYSGQYTIFCFTHFSQRGLGEINSTRRYNILRTPERTKSSGVVAYVDLKLHPTMELWSRVGDRWQNEVCCLDTKITNYIDKIVYDSTYMDNIERNHNSEIVYLQEKWGVERGLATERVKNLILMGEEDGVSDCDGETVSDEDESLDSLDLEMCSMCL